MSEPVKHPIVQRNTARKIDFQDPPEIGTVIPYYSGTLTLIDTQAVVKKDGSPGVVLVWRRNDGIIGTSGLSSNSLSYPTKGAVQ